MTNYLRYFAYGSNLHPLRLQLRVPSAKLLCTARLLRCRLRFHKAGLDDSGKCSIVRTCDQSDLVYGAVFSMLGTELALLDAAEGPGYYRESLQVLAPEGTIEVFAYIARPSHVDGAAVPFNWYRELVLCGARFCSFPAEYLARLQTVPVKPDPDTGRAQLNANLISRMTITNER